MIPESNARRARRDKRNAIEKRRKFHGVMRDAEAEARRQEYARLHLGVPTACRHCGGTLRRQLDGILWCFACGWTWEGYIPMRGSGATWPPVYHDTQDNRGTEHA